jgi:hypothetical protein
MAYKLLEQMLQHKTHAVTRQNTFIYLIHLIFVLNPIQEFCNKTKLQYISLNEKNIHKV